MQTIAQKMFSQFHNKIFFLKKNCIYTLCISVWEASEKQLWTISLPLIKLNLNE